MKKLYYSIGEVSELTGIETHVLRYWETVFPQLNPAKNRAGKRIYSDKNIETVLELKVLIKDKKYSTAGALNALSEKRKKDSDQDTEKKADLPAEVQRDLNEIRIFLKKLHDQL